MSNLNRWFENNSCLNESAAALPSLFNFFIFAQVNFHWFNFKMRLINNEGFIAIILAVLLLHYFNCTYLFILFHVVVINCFKLFLPKSEVAITIGILMLLTTLLPGNRLTILKRFFWWSGNLGTFDQIRDFFLPNKGNKQSRNCYSNRYFFFYICKGFFHFCLIFFV